MVGTRYIALGLLAFMVILTGVGAALLGLVPQADEARVLAALIGIFGPVLAGLGGLGLWSLQHRTDMRRAEDEAKRRQLRMLLALRAELILNLKAQAMQFLGETGAARFARYHTQLVTHDAKTDGPRSMPLSVVSDTNDAYDHIRPELSALPARVLPQVIGYYQNDEYVSKLLGAFSAGEFETLSLKRREQVLQALFQIGADTALAADRAIRALTEAIDEHDTRAGFAEKELELSSEQHKILDQARKDIADEQIKRARGVNRVVMRQAAARRKARRQAEKRLKRSRRSRLKFRRNKSLRIGHARFARSDDNDGGTQNHV